MTDPCSSDDVNLGDWLTQQCEALRLPIAQLARESGVDRRTLHRWMRGANKPYLESFRYVTQVIDDYWRRLESETRKERKQPRATRR